MARLYANENFPVDVVRELRVLGHDVLTTHDMGKSKQGIEDDSVLRYATDNDRCVITINRRDFMRLHRAVPIHGVSSYARRTATTPLSPGELTLKSPARQLWPIGFYG